MESFFRSVGQAFQGNRDALPRVEAAIFLLLALLVALQLWGLARRAWRRRSSFHQLTAARGLSPADTRWAAALAKRASIDPLLLLTHLDLFERATAQALQEQRSSSAPPSAGETAAERIRRVRHALGFDRLAAHTPLLSTRELPPGTSIEVGALPGTVVEVDESSFTVEVREPAPAPVGYQVSLALIHAREARYAMGCRLLSSRPAPGGAWHLALTHDESPTRIQQREYVRVRAEGIVALRPVSGWEGLPQQGAEVAARLVDVSGGGALVASRVRLPAGLLVLASLQVAGTRFEALRAVVLASVPAGDGHRAHLEFTGSQSAERERLAAAVTRLELQAQAIEHRSA
jgi:c-di-GMP-binding flagellar brake protein YcgR